MSKNQFVNLPIVIEKQEDDVGTNKATPIEMLVLAYIIKYSNSKKVGTAAIAEQKLCSLTGIRSEKTIRGYTNSLQQKGYLTKTKCISYNSKPYVEYSITNYGTYKAFEQFSFDFLEQKLHPSMKISNTIKAFLMAIQPHVYKNRGQAYGTIGYNISQIAKRIGWSRGKVAKLIKITVEQGYLVSVRQEKKDYEHGGFEHVNYHVLWDAFHQQIVYKTKEEIASETPTLEQLKEKNQELKQQVKTLRHDNLMLIKALQEERKSKKRDCKDEETIITF